jgi:hypothetical protein
VEKAPDIVMQDRRIATRLLAERLGVGKAAARQILERVFRKGRFVRGLNRTVKQFLASKSICVIQHLPLLSRFGVGSLSSLPEGETGTRSGEFQRH